MNSEELRKKFLDFFENKGHKIIPSSSLISENDPSVLFTTAGMQQFKSYYTGTQNPLKDNHPNLSEPLNSLNVATCQKCLRTSDIKSVGDKSHLTFFEMLGNFSFGGYFKKEAIKYALDFMTKDLKISLDRIKVSVFKGDDEVPFDKESYDTWLELGISKKKIILGSREDNFWGPTGEEETKEGPCGPTTEIYVDGIEIWNLVFNEYYFKRSEKKGSAEQSEAGSYQHLDKTLEPLKIKGIDTGMGLERLALIMEYPQDKQKTIYDTDLFKDLMIFLKSQGEKGEERIYRIIADHFRAIVFLTASGITSSNTVRGYVLSNLLKIIEEFSGSHNFKENWLEQAFEIIKAKYANFYPELKNQKEILSVIKQGRDKSKKTLKRGEKAAQKQFEKNFLQSKNKIISGKDAFFLYQSQGTPLATLVEMAKKNNRKIDIRGFEEAFRRHQEVSGASKEKKFGGHGIQTLKNEEDKTKITKLHTATHLLLQALRITLDDKIDQKGSDITPERLRLDFPFSRKLTAEEIKKVENLVNQKIQEDLKVHYYETSYEEAIRKGALGSFKDRYPEKVTVYEIEDSQTKITFSREICAGPHVKTTKEIGSFKILKEEAVGQGIRRIKATVE